MFESFKADTSSAPAKEMLLSFKPTGRALAIGEVLREFHLIKAVLNKPFTSDIAARIGAKSGSHLLKLVSPRVDGDHAVLRITPDQSNRRASLLPSVNAPDIPFCKAVFRPLEVVGHPPMSVVDHILNPVDLSAQVLDAFEQVFGEEVLAALRAGLMEPLRAPQKLGAGEFPIIFIPRPGGGDLQITPVSPAAAFMGIKRVADAYFLKATADRPRPPRARWTKQAVSSKPQNISGAIGGPRLRFLATMPAVMQQAEAELHRYAQGGAFPRWRDEDVEEWVVRYAKKLKADATYNNSDTRAALDRMADRLIRDAQGFITETMAEAARIAPEKNLTAPRVAEVLLRRRWEKDDLENVINALSSAHFQDRLHKSGYEEGAQ